MKMFLKFRQWLVESLVIVLLYVIISMRYAITINCQLFLYHEIFVQKQERNGETMLLSLNALYAKHKAQ